MAEKPILFNTEMVRAILEGRKRQTRRLVKPKHRGAMGFNVCFSKATGEITGVYDFDEDERMYDDPTQAPYQPGDVLYVRETWWKGLNGQYCYLADYALPDITRKQLGDGHKARPSIHMPKEAARLFLRVTGVRCERLQDMTPEDCANDGGFEPEAVKVVGIAPLFGTLWESTLRKNDLERYGWAANPWVWVIEFERIDRN
jgi:hypothetical protein